MPLLLCFTGLLVVRWYKEEAVEYAGGIENEKPNESFKIFAAAIMLRAAVLILMAAAAAVFKEETASIIPGFDSWDGRHYLNLIEQGYSGYTEEGKHLFLVFFPLYVWICRPIYWITGSSAAAGVLVSFFAFGTGTVYLYKLVRLFALKKTAYYTVLYISIFPFSFFYGLVMTESLFLLTTTAALYYIGKHKWLKAGIWGMLAALTRITGILIFVSILTELITYSKTFRKEIRTKFFILNLYKGLLPICGTIGYLLLNFYVDGNPFAFLKHQEHWYQTADFLPNVIARICREIGSGRTMAFEVWLPELFLFIGGIVLLIIGLREKSFPVFLLVYGFLYFVSNYSLSWPLSIGRYMSCCVPIFIILANTASKHKHLERCVTPAFSMLFMFYFIAFITGKQVM